MPDAFSPCIVFDTETTGFPGDKSVFRAEVIEVGAVVITEDLRIVSPINFFVWQPLSHLRHPMARRAMAVHQITVNEIQSQGLYPENAARRLVTWVERVQERHGVREARAYNQGFDFWFLQREPWSLFEQTQLEKGADIKETARQVMRDAGLTKHAPPLAAAVTFLKQQGHPIEWNSDAHRAMEDARMAALCAIYLHKEQREVEARSRLL